jgi:hypothetical protein
MELWVTNPYYQYFCRRLHHVVLVYIVIYVWSYASIAGLLPSTARQSPVERLETRDAPYLAAREELAVREKRGGGRNRRGRA